MRDTKLTGFINGVFPNDPVGAALLVRQKGINNRLVRIALAWFFVQLLMNTLWIPLFFGLRMLLLAFIEILLRWTIIFFIMVAFSRASRTVPLPPNKTAFPIILLGFDETNRLKDLHSPMPSMPRWGTTRIAQAERPEGAQK